MRATARFAPVWICAAALACSGEGGVPPVAGGEAAPAPFFVDIARAAGVDVVQISGGADVDYIVESLGAGGAWLDYDLDGDDDLYLVQGATQDAPLDGPPDRLFRNDGDDDGDGVPTFTDVTGAAGLGDTGWGVGAAVGDYDNDGDPDLYLTQWGRNRLYRNEGDGRFVEIGGPAGVADERWSASAAWTDADRDGDLDLYVANYVVFSFDRYPARGELPADGRPCQWRGIEIFCGPRNLEAAADRFYRNDGDADGDGVPTFVDVTDEAGLTLDEPLFALAVRAFDADDDGDDDLYVANDSVQNVLFVNRGDGTFVEESILAGVAYNEQGNEQAGMGIACGDYDGDGRLDLAVTNFSYEHDTLYRNDGDVTFTDVSYRAGIGTPSYFTLGWGVELADLDLDGRLDLYVAHGHVYPQVDGLEVGTEFRSANGLFRNRGDGTFGEFAHDTGPGLAVVESSRAVLPVDLEGDGDLDLLVTNRNAPPNLLRNDGRAGSWLAVRLRGRTSNADGIGARVTVEAGGRRLVREIRREASYAGSVPPVAHFGLGDATAVERLVVRWPSGRRTTLENVAADRSLRLDEADADAGDAPDDETMEELRSLGYVE